MRKSFSRITFAFVLAGTGFGLIPTALAHFPEPSPPGWNAWAEAQWNYGGFRCCNRSDVWLFEGRWQRNEDGGVTIWFEDGTERTLDRSRMVDRPRSGPDLNPTGFPVIWMHDRDYIFCFEPPGPLT